jgi:adenylate cyclase
MPANVFLRTLRLVTGLVLMAFVTGHLANLSIGLHSLAAMEDWLGTLMAPWQTPLGRVLLAGSALVHAALGLYAMAVRRTLAMKKTDWVQLVLGVLTPPLLLNHVLMTAIAPRLAADYEPSYGQLLSVYWSIAPAYAFQQLCVVLVVWVHAALGLYSWLVLKPVWRRIGGFVLPVLFAVPIVALLGFAEAGKEVVEKLANDAAWRDLILQNQARLDEARTQLAALNATLVRVYGGFVLLAVAMFAGRILRDRPTRVNVAYDAGFSAAGRRGLSILELSRLNGVPHADVCSGRGRCGTCRVHVTAGEGSLSPRNAIEDRTLERVHAAAGDRLACQARVLGAGVTVVRALPAYADASAARQPGDWAEDTPAAAAPTTVAPT